MKSILASCRRYAYPMFLILTVFLNVGIAYAAYVLLPALRVVEESIWVANSFAVLSSLSAWASMYLIINHFNLLSRALLLIVLMVLGIALIAVYAFIYETFGLMKGEVYYSIDFETAAYFSVVTWTTLGYGDYSPIPQLQILTAFEAIQGLMFFGIFVGVLANVTHDKLSENGGNRLINGGPKQNDGSNGGSNSNKSGNSP